ncbi:UNVERIFIED_CONTAM: hypothetical protein ABIC26_004417 [Paenibacillus sp. PvR008]
MFAKSIAKVSDMPQGWTELEQKEIFYLVSFKMSESLFL